MWTTKKKSCHIIVLNFITTFPPKGQLYGLEKFWAFLKYSKAKTLEIDPKLQVCLSKFKRLEDFRIDVSIIKKKSISIYVYIFSMTVTTKSFWNPHLWSDLTFDFFPFVVLATYGGGRRTQEALVQRRRETQTPLTAFQPAPQPGQHRPCPTGPHSQGRCQTQQPETLQLRTCCRRQDSEVTSLTNTHWHWPAWISSTTSERCQFYQWKRWGDVASQY